MISFAFFGTDDFSIGVLEELKKAGLLPALVVTMPDAPRGRGLETLPSPVSIWAQKNNVPISFDYSALTADYTLFVVASYGKIIPKRILDIPKHGALNVHPSLLPKYRGPSPVESQILANEKDIGVTIMQMDEKMDHGPIVASYSAPDVPGLQTHHNPAPDVDGLQTSGAVLRSTLAREGGKLLAEVIPKWVAGEIHAVPQDESKATYTRKFAKKDGEIDLTENPYQNFLKIRAFDGGIGVYLFFQIPSSVEEGSPTIVGGGGGVQKIRLKITDASFANGVLTILRVIPEGKKEMSYEEFLRGQK